jgi:Ca2+-binding RTX toxin-like protein
VITHPAPDTVVITGDGAIDAVFIRDNGAGIITGSATGVGVFGFVGIKEIRVLTNGGSDRVSYTLYRNLQPGQSRDVEVSLGSSPRLGQDTFVANLYNRATGIGSDLLAGYHLGITVFGGDGRDVIFVNAFKDTDVATGAELDLAFWGQAGNDVIMTYYRGENDGTVKLVSDSGVGTT